MPVNDFKWVENISEFNEDFLKSYNDESEEGYLLGLDVDNSENLHNLHKDLPFLPERVKIEKVEKLVANLLDKEEYVIHRRNLEQQEKQKMVLKVTFLKCEKMLRKFEKTQRYHTCNNWKKEEVISSHNQTIMQQIF